MKKWFILYVLSLLGFCYFISMNDPCLRGLTKDIVLYGMDIGGFVFPWFVVSLISVFLMVVFILSLIKIVKSYKKNIKWIFLFVALLPLFSVVYYSLEKEYLCADNPIMVSIDPPVGVVPFPYYEFLSVDEQKNEIILEQSRQRIVSLSVTPSCAASIKEHMSKGKIIIFYIRNNSLLGTHRLDAILTNENEPIILFRSRLQPVNELVIFDDRRNLLKQLMYTFIPEPTPTPAPTIQTAD